MGSEYTEEGQVMFREKPLQIDFLELEDDFYELSGQFSALCKLLGVAFDAGSFRRAHYVDQSRDLTEKLK